jgi:osmotically inducible protein OsmC
MILKAGAVWRGSGRTGNGDLSPDSGVLANTPDSFRIRFENEKGTNLEELIAAAYAGCFAMALTFRLQGAGYTPTELNTEAVFTLVQDKEGLRISRSASASSGAVLITNSFGDGIADVVCQFLRRHVDDHSDAALRHAH